MTRHHSRRMNAMEMRMMTAAQHSMMKYMVELLSRPAPYGCTSQ